MTFRRTADTLPGLDIEGLGLGPLRLEDLIDREALRQMAASFSNLFGIPIRIVSASDMVLAEVAPEAKLCERVNHDANGASACAATRTGALRLAPPEPAETSCFTGAAYLVIPILYDRSHLGRVVVGPYRPEGIDAPPLSLRRAAPGIDRVEAAELLCGIRTLSRDEVAHLTDHLSSVLDLILFSGHKALLTSKMHLAAMRESYRELTENNEKLAEAYDRLKELDRLKSNFLATISHELRTPLTSIMGYSEMLAEGIAGSLHPEQLEFVETIRTKSDQLLALILSLLDLSKLESGTTNLRKNEVALGTVLAEVLSTLAPVAAKKGVELRAGAAADLPPIYGDAVRLRQIFINLADNAIKFTSRGGSVALVAELVAETPGDEPGLVLIAPLRQRVDVRVVDTGVGIPEAERARIFDPFYQIDQSSTREHGGTGLGLAIVKRLVEAHQGSIRIEANAPRGAVFVVSLPVGRPSIPPAHPRGSTPPLAPWQS